MSFIYADCSELDNQEDCERIDGCEWIENDNMPGGYCTGDWEDDEEEWEACSDIDNQEDCERIDGCEWIENDNMPGGSCTGDWEDDEEEWEACSDIDNQEDCERTEGRCQWTDQGCVEGDWEDDEEEWEDCSELDNQEDCERTENCEWTDELGCYESSEGESLENNQIPSYSLLQNYPNPFNPITTINFSILESGNISLIVYDLSGKEVGKLVDGFYNPGNYNVKWNAIDYNGHYLSSGIYIYQLKTKNQILSNKMMLVR